MIEICLKCSTHTERYADGRCKPCTNTSNNESYARNGDKYRAHRKKARAAAPEKGKIRATSSAQRNKARLVKEFGDKCRICKRQFDFCVYQFHHKYPELKEKNISQMYTYSWEKLKKEADKCVMLCANCHSVWHFWAGKTHDKPWSERRRLPIFHQIRGGELMT